MQKNSRRRIGDIMSRDRKRRPAGAARQTEFPPFGDQDLRREWAARALAVVRLGEAVTLLQDWRERRQARAVVEHDELWIEARLEERVALLRFEERSHADIRSRTLTDESIEEVRATFEARAASADVIELEKLAAEFRQRYKPPIMPTGSYLPIEVLLSELLMKRRSLGWFEPSLQELRARRGVVVLKEGLTS
jgi:methane monooxygenase component A gamma chain